MRINWFPFFFLFFRFPKKGVPISNRYKAIIKVVQRMQLALTLIFLSIITGALGLVYLENYPWFDAFYMSVITLSTVGFGEIHPLSPLGRLFEAFLILFNLGLLGYSVTTLTGIFTEGGFAKLLRDYRMHRKIQQLKNHVIICGFGRHSLELTYELSKRNRDFVVIESKHERVELLKEKYDYLYIEGDATLDQVMQEARIMDAAALVTTLPSDADNMFIALSARQTNPNLRIISRATGPEDEVKIRKAGANYTVIPERIGGYYMTTLIDQPEVVGFFTLLSNMGPGNVQFEEIPVDAMAPHFKNTSIRDSGILELGRVSLVAVRQPNGMYELNPLPSLELRPGWDVVVLGSQEQVNAFKNAVLANSVSN